MAGDSRKIREESAENGNEEKSDDSEMAYKDMKNLYYYTATLLLFLAETFFAIFIPDIDVVFNFVSAFSVSCLGFFFPAVFFIWSEKKYGNNQEVLQRNKIHRIMAWFHLFFGTFIFLLCFTQSILSIIETNK